MSNNLADYSIDMVRTMAFEHEIGYIDLHKPGNEEAAKVKDYLQKRLEEINEKYKDYV